MATVTPLFEEVLANLSSVPSPQSDLLAYNILGRYRPAQDSRVVTSLRQSIRNQWYLIESAHTCYPKVGMEYIRLIARSVCYPTVVCVLESKD